MADLGALLGGVGIGGAIGKAVAALEELGDTGTLSGDELRAVLDLPEADPPNGSPRTFAATPARRPVSMCAGVADAVGVPRPTLVPAGVPPTFEGEPCLT